MKHSPSRTTYQKRALLLIILLSILGFASLLWILLHSIPSAMSLSEPSHSNLTAGHSADEKRMAYIYQNGNLVQSISLWDVTEAYRITIKGENNAENEIEVRPGSIGMISASCPDKLCVHQGFIDNSLLPVTCLPNRLVIQVRTEKISQKNEITPDVITY